MKWNFHSIFFPFYMVVKNLSKLQRSPSLHSSTFSHSNCPPSLFVFHMGINVPKSQAAPWVAPPCGLPDKSDRFTSWLGSPPTSSSSSLPPPPPPPMPFTLPCLAFRPRFGLLMRTVNVVYSCVLVVGLFHFHFLLSHSFTVHSARPLTITTLATWFCSYSERLFIKQPSSDSEFPMRTPSKI